ncbi:MAG: hypothetical protein KTR14_04335 [Vampirovibrio sp.]|nr:hypothetical protein [Vampirovibrio sp.]
MVAMNGAERGTLGLFTRVLGFGSIGAGGIEGQAVGCIDIGVMTRESFLLQDKSYSGTFSLKKVNVPWYFKPERRFFLPSLICLMGSIAIVPDTMLPVI